MMAQESSNVDYLQGNVKYKIYADVRKTFSSCHLPVNIIFAR